MTPLLAVLSILVGWLVLGGIVAYGLSRWFRWQRGDFDRRA